MNQFNKNYANHRYKYLILRVSNSVCETLRSRRRFHYDDVHQRFVLNSQPRQPRPQNHNADDGQLNVGEIYDVGINVGEIHASEFNEVVINVGEINVGEINVGEINVGIIGEINAGDVDLGNGVIGEINSGDVGDFGNGDFGNAGASNVEACRNLIKRKRKKSKVRLDLSPQKKRKRDNCREGGRLAPILEHSDDDIPTEKREFGDNYGEGGRLEPILFSDDVDIPETSLSGVAKLRTLLFNHFKDVARLCSLFCNIMQFLPTSKKHMSLTQLDSMTRVSLKALHYSAEDVSSLPPVTAATVDQLLELPGMFQCIEVKELTEIYIHLIEEETSLFASFRDGLMDEDLGRYQNRRIRYPRDADDAVEVIYKNLKELEPGQYVGSNLIDFYTRYIQETNWLEETIYISSAYNYSVLETSTAGDSFMNLMGWFISANLLDKSFLFFPVNMKESNDHWSLIIVWIDKDKDDVFILHLDSLGYHNSEKLFEVFKGSFVKAWKHGKGKAAEKSNFVYKTV